MSEAKNFRYLTNQQPGQVSRLQFSAGELFFKMCNRYLYGVHDGDAELSLYYALERSFLFFLYLLALQNTSYRLLLKCFENTQHIMEIIRKRLEYCRLIVVFGDKRANRNWGKQSSKTWTRMIDVQQNLIFKQEKSLESACDQ